MAHVFRDLSDLINPQTRNGKILDVTQATGKVRVTQLLLPAEEEAGRSQRGRTAVLPDTTCCW